MSPAQESFAGGPISDPFSDSTAQETPDRVTPRLFKARTPFSVLSGDY
jgi:hypothetical protein